jgi:hypothetical protein
VGGWPWWLMGVVASIVVAGALFLSGWRMNCGSREQWPSESAALCPLATHTLHTLTLQFPKRLVTTGCPMGQRASTQPVHSHRLSRGSVGPSLPNCTIVAALRGIIERHLRASMLTKKNAETQS